MTSRLFLSVFLFLVAISGIAQESGLNGSAGSAAPAMIPLELGNRWIYETADGRYSFNMSVGISEIHGGRVYSAVSGYGYGMMREKILVRQGEDGSLYTVDADSGEDILLTQFTHVPGAYFDTRLGNCEEQGQAAADRVPWHFGSESRAAAVSIHYRSFSCADHGLQSDLYVENLGLVRRTLNTFLGPLEFNLVYARVGKLLYRSGASSSLSLDLDRSHVARVPGEAQPPVRIKLRYAVEPLSSGSLRFRSGQTYDVFLTDASGNEVWRWSDTEAFIQPIVEIPFAGFVEFEAYLPAHKFPDGNYEIHGWLNTDSERQPTVGIPFLISSVEPAGIEIPPDAAK